MKRLAVLAAASTAVAALAGCGLITRSTGEPAAANAAGDRPTPTGSAVSSLGAARATSTAEAGVPDPCTLLSRSDVVGLTGRAITETDHDDAKPGEVSRYCQWQQDGGQLALFLTRTGEDDFRAGVTDAKQVDPVLDHDAYLLSDHLFVYANGLQVDVYSRGGTDEQNLTAESGVVKTVLPELPS